MKPVELNVCFKCVLELDGSVAFKQLTHKTEKCKCAFCNKESMCYKYLVTDYKEAGYERK